MTHAMTKGSNIQLHTSAVRAVLRWSPAPGAPDIDASALLLGPDGLVRGDADFVFYNQPRHPSGVVRHLAKTREPEGLADTVEADLGALEASVDRVLLAASADGGTFAQVPGGLRLLLRDATTSEPVLLFDIEPETGEETALICGELYRREGGWKFRALGQGYTSGLIGLATNFGVSVDDGQGNGHTAEPLQEPTHAHVPEQAGPPQQAGVPQPPSEPDPPEPEPVPAPRPEPRPTPDPGPSPEPPPVPPLPEPPSTHPEPQATVAAVQQRGYGYPQPPAQPPRPAYGSAPVQPPAPAYGYPPPPQPDPAFILPPQGPQFVSR